MKNFERDFCSICDNYYNGKYSFCKTRSGEGKLRDLAILRGWCGLGKISGEEVVYITPNYIERKNRIKYTRMIDERALAEAIKTGKGLDRFELEF